MNEQRAALAGSLARLSEAHDALVAEVTVTTLLRYEAACAEARRAFEAMVLAGVERAKARGFSR